MFHSKIIRDFLQNEDGGIFSVIGTALGGLFGGGSGKIISTALGGALGQRSDDRRAAGKQNALDMQKFVRLRKAAEMGGFHPLEALRSGQSIPASTGGRLQSSLSNSNAFDALEDELTGEGARQRKRESVEDEIRERELDKQRYDVAQQQTNQSSITRTRPLLGGGSRVADQAPDAMTASPELADAPTSYLSPEIQGSVAPEELLMENLNRGTGWQWVGDLADKNPVPHSFQEWSPPDFFIPGGKPGRVLFGQALDEIKNIRPPRLPFSFDPSFSQRNIPRN